MAIAISPGRGPSVTVEGKNFRSGSFTLADDAATSISLSGQSGFLFAFSLGQSPAATAPYGMLGGRANAAVAPVSLGFSDLTNVAFTTGALAGTTGTDGKLTFSINSADTTLHIENRLGGARNFFYTILAGQM